MSDAQGVSTVTGWGYWPSSDIYSLTPIWSESHTPQGVTAAAKDEEAITQHVVIDYGMPWSISVNLMDLGSSLLTTVDDVPITEIVRVESYLVRAGGWGFTKRLAFEASIAEDGTITLSIPPTMHDTLGINQQWTGVARAILQAPDNASLFAVKILFADITVIP